MACTIKRNKFGIIESVTTETGTPSQLFEQIATQPFIKNKEEALNFFTFVELNKPKVSEEWGDTFPTTKEPRIWYKTIDGYVDNYKDALTSSNGQVIEVGVSGKNGFIPYQGINPIMSSETPEGIINNAIINGDIAPTKVFDGTDYSLVGKGFSKEESEAAAGKVMNELSTISDNELRMYPFGFIREPYPQITLPETGEVYNPIANIIVNKNSSQRELSQFSEGYESQLEEIKTKTISDGTFMLAPNGQPTNLDENQWLMTRSKEFQDWFGDFINDPKNSSKAVDENGDPIIVYHGSENLGFTEFSITDVKDGGHFFSSDPGIAKSYARIPGYRNFELVKTESEAIEKVELSDGSVEANYYVGDIRYESIEEALEDNESLSEDAIEKEYYIYDSNGDLITQTDDLVSSVNSNEIKFPGYSGFFLNLRDPLQVDGYGDNWDNIIGVKTEDLTVSLEFNTSSGKYEIDNHLGEVSSFDTKEDALLFVASNYESIFIIDELKSHGFYTYKGDPNTGEEAPYGQSTREWVREANDYENDGVIFKDIDDNGPHGYSYSGDVYVVFDSENIKSLDNIGQFSSKDGDFRFSNRSQQNIPTTQSEIENVLQPITQVLLDNGFIKKAVFGGTSELTNKFSMDASNVKGAVDSDGNAYFNTDTMTMDTPIHEAGHIWNSITKSKNPELYAQGLTLIEEQGQEYINYVKQTQPTLQGEALFEEALAQAIGDSGARIINEKRNSNFKQWLSDLFDWIGEQLGISQYTGEELQNFTLQQFSTAVAIEMLKGSPTKIETPSIFKPLSSIKDSYEHSFVKPEDMIDIEGLIKDIISKGQTVSFWVGDQLGRGTYVDKFGNEHYLDGGISYALDPENRDRGVVWASGALEKNIKRLIKADYTFIISGSPKTSKLFNKKVFNIFSTRIEQLGYNYDSFKEKLVELKTPQSVVKYFNEFSSFEDLSNSPKRKEVLLKMISSVEGKKTDFANFIRDNGILPSSSGVTDGFLKENNFRINDVVLVLKLNSIGEQSTHSTYDKEILGEVIGVPDKIVNAYELLNPKKKKNNELGESLKSQIIAPYGIGDAQNVFLGSRFSKQQNPFETPKKHPDPNKKANFVKIGDVEISYNETDNHITLQLIESKGNRNSGQATKAMQTLVDYADSKGKSIDLFAAPRDKQTSENRLMEFYKKFGFQPKFEDFPQEMIRYPKRHSSVPKNTLKFSVAVHDETGFITPESMVKIVAANNPSYLTNVVNHIATMGEKLKQGNITTRDVAKAYLITVSSTISREQSVASYERATGLKVDEVFISKNNIRPESAMASFLQSESGRVILDKVEAGTLNREDLNPLVHALRPFGGWSSEDGKLKSIFHSEGDNKINLKNLTSLTNILRKGTSAEEEIFSEISKLVGVSSGKIGFVAQFLGIGTRGVIDAREIQGWLTGRLVMNSEYTPEQRILSNKLLGNTKQSKLLQEEILRRMEVVASQFGIPKEFAQYLGHHMIWDALGKEQTSHEEIYNLMRDNAPTFDAGVIIQKAFNPTTDTVEDFKVLIQNGTWGMLTGENPMGKTMSEIANYRANIRANTWLKERGYTPIEIKGMYEAPENSFFVQNLSVKDALDFAKEFNQESIATSEGFVYQDGTYNPRLPEQDSFGDTYEGYYSSINIAGNNVDFQVGYDFNSRLLIEPMNLENSDNYPNMTEDEEGNFVFNHWSAAKRDVIKPGQTGTRFTGDNETGAWSNVGGAAYYYTKDGDREPGLTGGVGHQIKIPKERVYDFNSDRQKFAEEAEKLFKEDNPSIAYSFNHQIAYLTKVANNNGYLMTVAKWNSGVRAQTTLPLEVFDVYIPGPNNSVEKQFNNQYLSNLKKGIEKNKDKQYEPTIDGLRQLTYDFDSKYSPEKLDSISGRLNDNNYTQIQKVFKSSIPESEKDKFFKVMHGAYPKAINFQPEHIQKRMREAINDNGSNDSGIRFSLAQRIIEDLAKNGNIDLNCKL